jgi:hypothetical protein
MVFKNIWFMMLGGSFFMRGKWLVHLDGEVKTIVCRTIHKDCELQITRW